MFLRKQRKYKNFINDPALQLKFAGSTVLLLLFMATTVIVYSHIFLQDVLIEVFNTPDIPEGAFSEYESMLGEYFLNLSGLMLFLSMICVAYIVVETHKIAGAKYAVLKHIKENMQNFDFTSEVKLREGDFLDDVACELNTLSEMLKKKIPVLPEKKSEDKSIH